VIVLISKPPAAEVAVRILSEARKAGKPVVVNFLGADPARISGGNVHGARTLEDAARAAVAIARGEIPRQSYGEVAALPAGLPPLGARQHYIRGLFSGGTFCYEAVLLLDERLADVYSNTPVRREGELSDLRHSHHHTMLDLGDDVFTRGRPHPMIDQTLRNERILQEAADPSVAVILLDVVLGYGAHPDPAGHLAQALAGRRDGAVIVASVTGTDADPQPRADQVAKLEQAGVMVADSNADAAALAMALASPAARQRGAAAQ
jgi:succinyl-CoA synthetase alpha subunit